MILPRVRSSCCCEESAAVITPTGYRDSSLEVIIRKVWNLRVCGFHKRPQDPCLREVGVMLTDRLVIRFAWSYSFGCEFLHQLLQISIVSGKERKTQSFRGPCRVLMFTAPALPIPSKRSHRWEAESGCEPSCWSPLDVRKETGRTGGFHQSYCPVA